MEGRHPRIRSPAMAARIVLLAAAVALVAAGTVRTSQHRACEDARRDTLAIGLRHAPASGAQALAPRLLEDCRGAETIVGGAFAFLGAGAVRPAAALAREAVAREPERRDAWIALARVRQREGDASGAARAL